MDETPISRGTSIAPGYDGRMDPLECFGMVVLRAGRVVRAESNDKARKPAYKLWIDLGPELGTRQSSAQITDVYTPEMLVGTLVVAAVNLGTRNVGGFESEVLVLGVPDVQGRVVLLTPERDVPVGGRVC